MLTASAVRTIFLDCLFKAGEEPLHSTAVVAEGIIDKYGFHPGRLEGHKPAIMQLLMCLPDTFRESVGGGWSFLQACKDNQGNHWGEHIDMEQLFSLGIATGQAEYLMKREMWRVLPGGVPYIVIKDKPIAPVG